MYLQYGSHNPWTVALISVLPVLALPDEGLVQIGLAAPLRRQNGATIDGRLV